MTPYYAGRALNLRTKGARIQLTREILEHALWMPYCGLRYEAFHQQELLQKSVEDFVADLYAKWIYEIGDNPRAKLDRFLMRRCNITEGLLRCNIDPSILTLCREAAYWIALKFIIPVHVQIVFDKWETLNFVFESVIAVVIGYNKVIKGWLANFIFMERSFHPVTRNKSDQKLAANNVVSLRYVERSI